MEQYSEVYVYKHCIQLSSCINRATILSQFCSRITDPVDLLLQVGSRPDHTPSDPHLLVASPFSFGISILVLVFI